MYLSIEANVLVAWYAAARKAFFHSFIHFTLGGGGVLD